MDQHMHTDAISAVDSTAPGSNGILLAGTSGENRHMMQAQQGQHECDEETVEFHQPSRRPLWPDPDTIKPTSTTMTDSSNNAEEGPVYTESGLQLTHRPSPLRGTVGRGNGKNFGVELKKNDHDDDDNNNNNSHKPPAGRMEFLSLQNQEQHKYHEQRQKRLLAYVRLGVVALCAVLAVGSKIFVSTALHEHRLMAAAAAAAAATDATSTGTSMNANDKVGADGARELQNTKMGKVMKPPSLSASAEATNKTSRRKKRHYAEEVVRTLRLEFDAWSEQHSRDYGSAEETERRFGVWMDNHHE